MTNYLPKLKLLRVGLWLVGISCYLGLIQGVKMYSLFVITVFFTGCGLCLDTILRAILEEESK